MLQRIGDESDMSAVMKTDIGLVRQQNEDAAWYDEKAGLFAVADGMGGHLAGEVASEIAVKAVEQMAHRVKAAGLVPLKTMVNLANREIVRLARENSAYSGMGTTLSVLWVKKKKAYIAHVGDSRIYRFRDGHLEQMTRDHSLVEELVEAGIISREEARNHPRRNIITRALGTDEDNTPDLIETTNESGDIWLLCSDGLSGMLDDTTILNILQTNDLNAAAERLLEGALSAGGKDNVTLVLCREGG